MPAERHPPPTRKRHCVGLFSSRQATIAANTFLLAGALYIIAAALAGLYANSKNTPSEEERLERNLLIIVLLSGVLKIGISSFATWGAYNFMVCPVQFSIVFEFVGVMGSFFMMCATMNSLFGLAIAIQLILIIYPQVSYVEEVKQGILSRENPTGPSYSIAALQEVDGVEKGEVELV